MKKMAILLIALFVFSQVSFSNWSAGGKNSVSGVSLFNYSANYARERLNWFEF